MNSRGAALACLFALMAIPSLARTADGLTPDVQARYLNDQGVPRYDHWVQDYFDELFRVSDTKAFKAQKHKFSGNFVLARVRLWQVTGDERQLHEALVQFEALMGFAPKNEDILHDCFGFFPVLFSGYLLKAAGKFDPALEGAFTECVAFGMQHLRERRAYSDGNQDLARVCAIACAVRLYPQQFASFRPMLEKYWSDIITTGDLWLDSKTYTPVSILYLCTLADMLDRTDDIGRSTGFRQMFGNFRDVLSPNGLMPEFGHAYFEPPGQPEWLYVFEWAAALYQDPTFLFAAQKFFHQLVRQGRPTFKNGNDARLKCRYALIGLMPRDRTEIMLSKLGKCPTPASPPQLISGITRRRVAGQGERDAFLILRSSLEPGAPMLMMNLLSWGDHALFDQRPSIGYYETGHVPHFYQYGRYAQAASRGNVVLLTDDSAAFPDDGWPANTWRTLRIPLERFDGDNGSRTIDKITLRTFGDLGIKHDQTLTIDRIRIFGPRGERMLYDFEDGIDWTGKELSRVEDATSGRHVLKIKIVTDSVAGKPLGLTVDLAEYTTFAMDVKWSGRAMPRVQVRPSVANTAWTQVSDMPLLSEVRSASVNTRGKDSFASVEFSPYGTFDTRLVRQIILTEEGFLLVRDKLLPGASADKSTAGTLWQMYSTDQRGENWFSTNGEKEFSSVRLTDNREFRSGFVAWFPKRPGCDIGMMEVDGGKGGGPTYASLQRDSTWRVAYARQQVSAGTPTWFNLVVVPHAPGADAKVLASGITVNEEPARSVYRVRTGSRLLEATIDEQGQWNVRRGEGISP